MIENILDNFEELQSNLQNCNIDIKEMYESVLNSKEELKDALQWAINNNCIESIIQDLNIIFNS